VHDRLDLAFEQIGPLTLKNITRPVEVFVVRLDPAANAAPASRMARFNSIECAHAVLGLVLGLLFTVQHGASFAISVGAPCRSAGRTPLRDCRSAIGSGPSTLFRVFLLTASGLAFLKRHAS
jgi:hypothetical protein